MNRPLAFMPQAWEDYLYWQMQDRKTLKRINQLLRDIQRDPFDGIGKPEPLRGAKSGYWSRRIDDTHRLVYHIADDTVTVLACRGHYDD